MRRCVIFFPFQALSEAFKFPISIIVIGNSPFQKLYHLYRTPVTVANYAPAEKLHLAEVQFAHYFGSGEALARNILAIIPEHAISYA